MTMNEGLKGRDNPRDFVLNMNMNFTLANPVVFGSFDGDAQIWSIFNIFGRIFPVGTKFRLKRLVWNLVIYGVPVATNVVLEIDRNFSLLTSLTAVGSGDFDSGILDIEYEQVLASDFLGVRMYKLIPLGASGNISGTAQLYCQWVTNPFEVF